MDAKSFRTRDINIWANDPTILGFQIHLSKTTYKKAGERCDICKMFAGNYPTWFLWNQWHEGCICFITPILLEDDVFDKYIELVATGDDTPENIATLRKSSKHYIDVLPDHLVKWVNDKYSTLEKYNSAPAWVKDNFSVNP